MKELDLYALQSEASLFAKSFVSAAHSSLFGTTDGKAIGSYIQHAFDEWLLKKYTFEKGNKASGLDFPALNVDLKVTKASQPQSSCPFKSASQKVFGLGYHILLFVYNDFISAESPNFSFLHVLFIDQSRTSDHRLTSLINQYKNAGCTKEELVALFNDRNLPLDDIGASALAERVLNNDVPVGYLTISNAQQWRLQYGRAISTQDITGLIHLTPDVC